MQRYGNFQKQETSMLEEKAKAHNPEQSSAPITVEANIQSKFMVPATQSLVTSTANPKREQLKKDASEFGSEGVKHLKNKLYPLAKTKFLFALDRLKSLYDGILIHSGNCLLV
jgi:hypothetical protein